MLTRTVLLLAIAASLLGCDRLAHQSSLHVRLDDEAKGLSDFANGLAAKLRLAAQRSEFDYGVPGGQQTVYKLTSASKVIFVQTESAAYCVANPDPEHITFDDRLLVVNLSASTREDLAASIAALRQVSATNGGAVLADRKQVCAQVR